MIILNHKVIQSVVTTVAIILNCDFSRFETVEIKNYYENPINFYLSYEVDGKTSLVKSNKGILEISSLNQSGAQYFTLFLEDNVAEAIYESDLYFENGLDLNDEHINYDEITVTKLLEDEDGIFFLRTRERYLDPID